MSDVSAFQIPDGIMAMTDDDGTVVSLLKRDPKHGAVYRHDGEWLPVLDPRVFDGLAFVGVSDSAEAVYDKYEVDDKLVTIGHYVPSVEGPFWPYPVREYPEPETANELAAAKDYDAEEVESKDAVAASAVLNSADDLADAIAAAVADPNLRWYVERRVAAIGLEADLPWLEG